MAEPIATVTTLPFSRLVAGDAVNARATKGKDGLDALTASIAAKGLIQPLAVRPLGAERDAKHEIVDGRRRYQALARLVKAGTIPRSYPVPVLVRDEDDATALETSLAANITALPMHPVDQYVVFSRLAEAGLSEADIAARFGLAPKTVKQQRALGRLAPEIREAWRKGKLDAKVAQLFTIEPDPELQVAAYERLRKGGGGLAEWHVRQELSGGRPKLKDPEVAFVGLEAYLEAGGTVSESLFEEQSYLDDGALLKKLVADKLEAQCELLVADGWSWAAIADTLPDDWEWRWEKRSASELMSKADRKRWEALDEQMPGADDKAAERIEAKMDALELKAFTPEIRAAAGCVVDIGHDGQLDITFGVTKPGDVVIGADAPEDADEEWDGAESDEDPDAESEDERDDDAESEERTPAISGALMLTVTETLTKACARSLAEHPEVAMRAAIAALVSGLGPVTLRSSGWPAATVPRRAREFDEVLAETDYDRDVMVKFAGLVAAALDLRRYHPSSTYADHDALRDALPADSYLAAARELFLAEDYFKRASKQVAIDALEEMGQGACISRNAKKADLAAQATDDAKRLGWLPPELRHADYALIDPSAKPARGAKKKAAAA